MNNLPQPIEISYTTIDWGMENASPTGNWDPGFDAERCVVFTKLGPFRRLFEKPGRFKKRFYHTLYPLTIEHWTLTEQIELYDGFCTIDVTVHMQFQATFKYLQEIHQLDTDINAYIKNFYEALVHDIVKSALFNLTDGAWVKTGLGPLENAIALAINELLLAQNIQMMALCQLKPFFKEFPDIKFKEESIYLMALKKNYEIINRKQQEQFLQEQALEKQRIEQLQKHLELIKQDNALELQKQAQQAGHARKLLLDQEAQQAEQFAVEQRLHAEKLKHETALYELSLKENFHRQEQETALKRQLEIKDLDEKIAHQQVIKEQELAARIKAFEQEKQLWNSAKTQWQTEDIKHKQRQKQLEIDAELENKVYFYQQQLKFEQRDNDAAGDVSNLNRKK